MDKKQKEALVLAMLEKGESYRSIAKAAGVSPNTIKSISNRAGLDESTSISSRAFELFSEGKTPLQVAIALNLEAEKAIQYHQQYYILLGCTEFTKVYPQIKDNPWPYVNLVKLAQSSGIGDSEAAELLKIANGHLPRIRLEYDRLKEEINWSKAELNSWKAELNNTVRMYQQFVDRNIALKKREDELQLSINELGAKESELQRTISGLKRHQAEFQEDNVCSDYLNLEIKQEEDIFTTDVYIPPLNTVNDHHVNENETHCCPSRTEPSSRQIIFDTKDLFLTKAQT
jgi:hypothetical protein